MGSRTWRGQRERIAWGLGRVHLLGGTIQQQLLLPRGCAGKALQSGSVPVRVWTEHGRLLPDMCWPLTRMHR